MSDVEKSLEKSIANHDGWENTIQGVGQSGIDPSRNTQFNQGDLLCEIDVQALYTDEGIAARIVNLVVEDMLRSGFKVAVKDPEADVYIQKRFEGLKLLYHLNRLFCWARACGGAVMTIGFKDGETDLSRPLNEQVIKGISFVKVFDRFRVSNIVYDKNILSDTYLQPLMYTISPYNSSPFTIHASRCIVVDGVDCLDSVRVQNLGWGLSVYQNLYDPLMRIGRVFCSISVIVDSFVQDVIGIEGLHAFIAAGKEDVIKKRLQYIDAGKHVLNSILLDKNETFTRQVSSVSGLADLIDRFGGYISSTSGIPQTLLFGRSPAGLNATGDSDTRGWYDRVKSKQETDLRPVLERFIHLLFICKEGYKKEPEDWSIEFYPLMQMSAPEEATYRKTIAETDKLYVDSQVATPDEVAFTRFSGGRYSDEPLKIVFSENTGSQVKQPESKALPEGKEIEEAENE